MTNFKIGFIGLTHLGLVSSLVAAIKGFKVISYDFDKKKIDSIVKNNIHLNEPKYKSLLNKNKKKITFTHDFEQLNQCKLVFFSYDTPINSNNSPDYQFIISRINKLILKLNKETEIVILSQVYPGFTEQIKWPKNKLFYQVETLVFGKAIERANKPERLIIGCNNKSNFQKSFLNRYLKKFNSKILVQNYKSAELSKISINLFLISSINTSNMISEMCEKTGSSWIQISEVLKSDKRIGKNAYLNPNLNLGGTNLLRDLSVFKQLSSNYAVNSKLVDAWIYNNNYYKKWIFNKLDNISNITSKRISILGLTYKEDTDSIKNSISIEIIKKYSNHKITAYDPMIKMINFNFKCNIAKSIKDCISNFDILLLMTPWKEFYNLKIKKFDLKNKIIIDPHNILLTELKKNKYKKLTYHSLGETSLNDK